MESKACSKCGEIKPLLDYPRKSNRKDGRGSACNQCHRLYTRRHYAENREYYKNKAHNTTKKVRAFLDSLKSSTPCKDCGESYPAIVMDFDHLRDKDFDLSSVSSSGVGFAKVKAEIKKCDIVCSNCHRLRTAERLKP